MTRTGVPTKSRKIALPQLVDLPRQCRTNWPPICRERKSLLASPARHIADHRLPVSVQFRLCRCSVSQQGTRFSILWGGKRWRLQAGRMKRLYRLPHHVAQRLAGWADKGPPCFGLFLSRGLSNHEIKTGIPSIPQERSAPVVETKRVGAARFKFGFAAVTSNFETALPISPKSKMAKTGACWVNLGGRSMRP